MTLAEAVAEAQNRRRGLKESNGKLDILDTFILDAFEADFPCGYVRPEGSSGIVIAEAFKGAPDEARAYAAALLHAADEAER